MMSSCDVSVIVVSYNIEKLILPCLRSILKNNSTLKTEVFVVDNHSSDRTANIVKAEFPQVHLIANHENRGFSRANNQAIELSKGRYLFLLNPDAQVMEDAIEKMVAFMDAHAEIGIVGPRIYNSDHTIQGSARGFPDFSTAFFGRTSVWTRVFPGNPLSRRNVPLLQNDIDQPQNVDWISGAAMLIRRKALDQIGFFSEDYFLFWEDADLCYRMKQAGWTVSYFPDAKVIHHVGESVKKEQARSIIEFHRSAYVWYRKYRVKSSWGLRGILARSGLFMRMIFKLIVYLLRKPFKQSEIRTE